MLFSALLLLAACMAPALPAPAAPPTNPFLSIAIDRGDIGHAFQLAVDRASHNLVVTGK